MVSANTLSIIVLAGLIGALAGLLLGYSLAPLECNICDKNLAHAYDWISHNCANKYRADSTIISLEVLEENVNETAFNRGT